MALIYPREMETEDVFVKEVTKSREKKTHSFFQPRRPVFHSSKQTNKCAFMLNVAPFSVGIFPKNIPVQAAFFFFFRRKKVQQQ